MSNITEDRLAELIQQCDDADQSNTQYSSYTQDERDIAAALRELQLLRRSLAKAVRECALLRAMAERGG